MSAPTAPKEFYIPDTSTKEKRLCTILVHILSQGIAYASWYDYPFLWFDKECINQSDSHDQKLGIQSMDIVYNHSLYPLGLMQSHFNY